MRWNNPNMKWPRLEWLWARPHSPKKKRCNWDIKCTKAFPVTAATLSKSCESRISKLCTSSVQRNGTPSRVKDRLSFEPRGSKPYNHQILPGLSQSQFLHTPDPYSLLALSQHCKSITCLARGEDVWISSVYWWYCIPGHQMTSPR